MDALTQQVDPREQSPAARIIAKFGGTRAAAKALGLAPTTVQTWKETGRIPAHRQQLVLATAKGLQIDISPADFFDQEEAA
jgi:DNA-binding transcriptional regulator YdaS (Cro superfamily)